MDGREIEHVEAHNGSLASGTQPYITMTCTAKKDDIISQSDIVSSDNITFQFKGTAITANDPIGTYNTYNYTTNSSSTNVICATPPTAGNLPTNTDGVLLTGEPENNRTIATCNNPSRYSIKVGVGLKGFRQFAYAGTNRTTPLEDTFDVVSTSTTRGIQSQYDEKTGLLWLDTGAVLVTAASTRNFMDITNPANFVTSAYTHFSLSKNPVVNAIDAVPVVDFSFENVFSARIANNGTASITSKNADWIDSVVRNSAGRVTINFKAGFFSQAPSVVPSVDVNSRLVYIATQPTTTSVEIGTRQVGGTFDDNDFEVVVQRQGSDYRQLGSTAAVIATQKCYAHHELAANTNGGSPTTSAWTTRVLNVITGDCNGISLAANTLTLPTGTYRLEACAIHYKPDNSKLRWRNTTDNVSTLVGHKHYSANSGNDASNPCVRGQFVITKSTDFQLQYYVTASPGANGLGFTSVNDGEVEKYATVVVERIR